MQNSASFLRLRILNSGFANFKQSRVITYNIARHVSSSPPSRIAAKVGHENAPPKVTTSSSTTSLAKLPLSHVVRSFLIMSMSSSNVLLNGTMGTLNRMLRSRSALFDPDRNPALNWILRRTFYDQFCAGNTKQEIEQTIDSFHRIGYRGIILEYAPEVLDDASGVTAESTERDIEAWKQGMLDTLRMVDGGDFMGFKWSGMGPEALRLLKHDQPPSPSMAKAMEALCDAAAAKGVRLLPAAEPQNANKAVDAWSIELASKYNREPNSALVYNTYQCYLKSTAGNLSRHLADAAEKGYTLGIKLVRGAYLETEQRDLIWDTKAETDEAYDAIATSLLEKKYGEVLKPASDSPAAFPDVNIMLATHNEESVQNAQAIIEKLSPATKNLVRVDYAQLQGMADEVSCGLLSTDKASAQKDDASVAKVYKCVTWGSTAQCLHYLLRRAAENRDAFTRTVHTRKAMGRELRRRFASIFGLG